MHRLGLFFLCLIQFSCASQIGEKINGVSFVASRKEVAKKHVEEVLKVHANHAAVMPFGFIRDIHSPEVIFDTDRQWYGETTPGARQYIEVLHGHGIQVMLKPQIWIWRGEFTGTLEMRSEADWKTLETTYRDFILNYARLAQETQVSIFCIGTELEKFVKNRPGYWKDLVAEIRGIYSGKLTYAANWDEYPRVPFWEALDYIGIDAYFPLSDAKSPSTMQLKEGWQKWKNAILELSEQKDKPVLFTEYGYRSMDYTAKKPWLVDQMEERVNMEAQMNATKAILEEFWTEDWFAGGYIWKWFIEHSEVGGGKDNRFTPQNKPAQTVLRDFYRMY